MLPSPVDVEAAYHEGRARWDRVELPLARFADLCRERQVDLSALRLRPDDLYLAYAAGLNVPGGPEALDRNVLSKLPPHLRRVGTAADAVADVLQVIRERLLTGPPPRLLAYNGTAPLRSWIKVIAVRLAIDVARTGSAVSRTDRSSAAEPVAPPVDPLALLAKAQYKARLEEALRDELAKVPPDQRQILRMHFVENESVDAIARKLGIHRVTVARWLWKSGEQIFDGLRRRFHDQFSVSAPDFDSLVRLMRSNMSLDLRQLLGDGDPAT